MKHTHNNDFKIVLHEKGLKLTPLRVAILEVLTDGAKPLAAEEISNFLDVEFDKATLFRCLKVFTEKGILNSVDLGEGFNRYEINCERHHHHHHIMCRECKKIEIVPFCIPKSFLTKLEQQGYHSVEHRMDFSGICASCS